MKYFDKVQLNEERNRYKNDSIFVGEIGKICLPEIRDGQFNVRFETGEIWNAYKYCMIKIED